MSARTDTMDHSILHHVRRACDAGEPPDSDTLARTRCYALRTVRACLRRLRVRGLVEIAEGLDRHQITTAGRARLASEGWR